ncbi:DUF4433 domain-containing protein [Hydrogenophilus islandicus]
MSPVPQRPQIYHITHVENLPSIIRAGGLWSDVKMMEQGGPMASIGMNTIKVRRLNLPVKCHPGDRVGDYVPFYFCPRSVMLYVIHCANHPELSYHGGQDPIVHLEADLKDVLDWAESEGRRWAFSLSNAGAVYAEFRNRPEQLDEIDWEAVAATDFRNPAVKEGKQAEFLVHEFFPWRLVRRIGVRSPMTYRRAAQVLAPAQHKPPLEVIPNWYF